MSGEEVEEEEEEEEEEQESDEEVIWIKKTRLDKNFGSRNRAMGNVGLKRWNDKVNCWLRAIVIKKLIDCDCAD
jgi:hypothetical protein